MPFQVDMSPLERSSQNVGNAFSQAGGAIANAMQANQQQDQQAQQQELMQLALSGDPKALEQVYAMSPEVGMQIAQKLQGDAESAQAEKDMFEGEKAMATSKVVEQIFLAKTPEEKNAIFEAAIPDERFNIDEEDRDHFMDEGAQKAIVGRIMGQDYANNIFGKQGKTDSLPAEAVAFNDLIKDMTPKQQKTAKLVKAGLKGRSISNAELSAIESGEIKNYSDYKIKQRQAEKFAEMTGSSRARAIDQGIEKMSKIDVGLSNIDAAIQAVNDGAGTGAIEKKFPSLKAASIALDNIQGRMALDVIGAVTFGALSQGELDLARDVALPTGLEGPELIKYLQDRKIAQTKLRDYYSEQIQFLDQGGTVAGFLRTKERNQQNKSDQEEVKQDLSNLSDDELFN